TAPSVGVSSTNLGFPLSFRGAPEDGNSARFTAAVAASAKGVAADQISTPHRDSEITQRFYWNSTVPDSLMRMLLQSHIKVRPHFAKGEYLFDSSF
ncbi:hypothetical protein RYX36_012555, partial [Vicia faba]